MERFEARLEVSCSAVRKEMHNAPHANFTGPDRRGRFVMAGESIHSYAGNHQIDLECSRGHRRRVVAPGRVWTLSLSLANPRRHLGKRL